MIDRIGEIHFKVVPAAKYIESEVIHRQFMFSKTDHAYETLRRKILDGVFKPGDPLRLSTMARELNLSEMPVREALRLLQKDGLVVMNLHRSAHVAHLSFRRAWEIEEVRLNLEIVGCVSAAPYHDEVSIARLREHLRSFRVNAERPAMIARRNRSFHTELLERAPNLYLQEQVEELWDRAWRSSSASFFDFMPHRIAEVPAENAEIIELVAARDQERLEVYLRKRLAHISLAWRDAIQQREDAGV